MPKQYEAIRDNLLAKGKSPKIAKRIAAATYNKNRPAGATPVGPKTESSPKSRRSNLAKQYKKHIGK